MLVSDPQSPIVKINDEQVSSASLAIKLDEFLQDRQEKVVLVEAQPVLSFGEVGRIIDTTRSTGAKVVLITPGI